MNTLNYKRVCRPNPKTCMIHDKVIMNVHIGNGIFCPVCLGVFVYTNNSGTPR